jgi:hypothetical protein
MARRATQQLGGSKVELRRLFSNVNPIETRRKFNRSKLAEDYTELHADITDISPGRRDRPTGSWCKNSPEVLERICSERCL